LLRRHHDVAEGVQVADLQEGVPEAAVAVGTAVDVGPDRVEEGCECQFEVAIGDDWVVGQVGLDEVSGRIRRKVILTE
jgi:hypothetical protein